MRDRALALAVVALVGVASLARFAPEAARIDRVTGQHAGRFAIFLIALALVVAAAQALRDEPLRALPVVAVLLAAAPVVVGHTKWVLALAAVVVAALAALELVPRARGLAGEHRLHAKQTGAAVLLFLCAWALQHHLWYGRHEIVDTPIYQGWADKMAAGHVPYRDFSVEYPPGALPTFLAPRLTASPGDFGQYGHSFEKWMALCGVATILFVGWALAALRAPPQRAISALLLAASFPLLLGNVEISRFDLWPAALAAGAAAALLARRELLSAVLLALAVLAKLYPAVLVPIALAYLWRRSGRRIALRWLALVAGIVVVGFLPFAVIAPGGVAHSFSTQLGRPLQLESLGSSLLIAAHHVAAIGLTLKSDHGSQNVEGPAPTVIGVLTSLLQLAAVVWTWIAFARGPATRERLVVASAAAVTAFVAFGKVFSPQYMVWLVPVVALVALRAAWWTLAAALVLTQLWFPDRYWALALGFHPFESWALLARNLTVAALFAFLAAELQDERLGKRHAAREPREPVGREVQV